MQTRRDRVNRLTHTDIKQHRTMLEASLHATKRENSGNDVEASRKVGSREKDKS